MTEVVTSFISSLMSNNQATSSRPTLHLSAESRESFTLSVWAGPDTMLLVVTMSVFHIPGVMMISGPAAMINFTHIKAP